MRRASARAVRGIGGKNANDEEASALSSFGALLAWKRRE